MLSNAVLSCSRLETLSSVTVYFGSKSSYNVIPDLFEVLGDLSVTTPCLRALSFIGFANRNYEAITFHSNFFSVLERLQSLKLQFVHTSRANDHPHLFFDQFIITWPTPVMANLTNLVLSSDSYWGYRQKVDLSRLYFQHLKVLALSKYTFGHDRQLQWITKHGETLQGLYLYDCPIVARTLVCGYFDNEGYPIMKLDTYSNVVRENIYPATWSAYLQEMTNSLEELQIFKMTHESKVDRLGPNSKRDSSFFETYEDMKISLEASRYMDWDPAYNSREPWQPWQPWRLSDLEKTDILGRFASDTEALETMLRTVEARRLARTTY